VTASCDCGFCRDCYQLVQRLVTQVRSGPRGAKVLAVLQQDMGSSCVGRFRELRC
jgi:hypothetical protein